MAYAKIIRVSFTNNEGNIVYCDICDTSVDLPDPEVVHAKGTENPLNLTYDDNEKFKGIKSLSATIRFLSTSTLNLSDFISGESRQWLVRIYINSDIPANIKFLGFLVNAGVEQSFLPNPRVIQLTATDNLGTIKDVLLTNKADSAIREENLMVFYIAMALSKTGLTANINVINNIMEEDTPTEPLYSTGYLHAKTFEADIGEAEDCYTVIEKILGDDGRLFQYKGEWWIVRLDEYSSTGMYRHIFDDDGNFVSSEPVATWNKTIGKNEAIKFGLEDAVVGADRPHKFIKEVYPYENPKDIIDNIDFSLGDEDPTIVGLPAGYTGYTCNYWTKKERTSGIGSVESNSTLYDFFIVRKHENGYEKERYLQINVPSSPGVRYIKSDYFLPVKSQDKVSVGVDFRMDTDKDRNGIWNQPIMTVELVDSGGNRYQIQNDGKWVLANNLPGAVLVASWEPNLQNETHWQSISCESDPAPVDGKIYIWLHAGNRDASTTFDDMKFFYQNLRIDYIPHINGSYKKYKAQHHKVTQTGGFDASRDREIAISDSPRVIFKGAILKQVGGEFISIDNVYNGAVFPLGLPDPEFLHTFAKTQAFAVWNQYKRPMRIFRGTALGLGTDLPSLIHVFNINATTDNTTNKQFILLGCDLDLKSCKWTYLLAEVYDTVSGRDYDDAHEFKYVSA